MADARQFVVQRHETAKAVHWDLMLEQQEALATWQVPVPPEQVGEVPLGVDRIVDHPKRFLTYEGPLRSHPGSVQIHDRGSYTTLTASENIWVVSIDGEWLKGTYRLSRQAGPCPNPEREAWTVVKVAE